MFPASWPKRHPDTSLTRLLWRHRGGRPSLVESRSGQQEKTAETGLPALPLRPTAPSQKRAESSSPIATSCFPSASSPFREHLLRNRAPSCASLKLSPPEHQTCSTAACMTRSVGAGLAGAGSWTMALRAAGRGRDGSLTSATKPSRLRVTFVRCIGRSWTSPPDHPCPQCLLSAHLFLRYASSDQAKARSAYNARLVPHSLNLALEPTSPDLQITDCGATPRSMSRAIHHQRARSPAKREDGVGSSVDNRPHRIRILLALAWLAPRRPRMHPSSENQERRTAARTQSSM